MPPAKPKADAPPAPAREQAATPPQPTAEQRAAAEILRTRPAKAPAGISEEEIATKVRAGLRRDQAIEVLQAQASHDAAQTKRGSKS